MVHTIFIAARQLKGHDFMGATARSPPCPSRSSGPVDVHREPEAAAAARERAFASTATMSLRPATGAAPVVAIASGWGTHYGCESCIHGWELYVSEVTGWLRRIL